MTRAIYAGSFDPLTMGHMWMIQQATKLFDVTVVAIGNNPAKKTMFTVEERRLMLDEAISQLIPFEGEGAAVPATFDGYLVKYAQSQLATHILRGVRNSEDFEYERVMRNLNGDFQPAIQTVLLIPPRELAEVSSSIVKDLIGPPGWEDVIKPFVPQNVYERLLEHSHGLT
jgi:pantetheine-phosphate adenylyltransferase